MFRRYCFFHWPTFINYVKARHQDNDRSFQASVLAVCAVAAARLRDGACNELLKVWSPPSSQSDSSAITDIAILSNVNGLRSAALSSISSRASISEPEFDDLRATALLAILGVQNGDFDQLQIMLGQYHGMSAQLAFHDESQWPEGLEKWEVQERRCLVRIYLPCFRGENGDGRSSTGQYIHSMSSRHPFGAV